MIFPGVRYDTDRMGADNLLRAVQLYVAEIFYHDIEKPKQSNYFRVEL